MNNIKKTLLLASVLALGTKVSIDMNVVNAYAAEKKIDVSDVTKNNANKTQMETLNNTDTQEVKDAKIENNTQTINNNQSSESVSSVATDELTDEEKAILSINEGTEKLSDYTLLRIANVKSDNLSVVRQAIKEAKVIKGSNLTKEEIANEVKIVVQEVKDSINRINLGEATVSDYQILKITQVNSNNLQDLNSWLKGKRYITISKISTVVNSIVTAVTNINNGTSDSESDYSTLEIYDVKSANIPIIRKSINEAKVIKGCDLTTVEIKNVVEDTLNKVKVILENINLGEATLDEYKFIGAINVNEINLADINEWEKGKRWTEISNVIEEIDTIVGPLSNINSGNDEVQDYETLEIENVNDDNLNSIRVVIASKREVKGADLTKAEIKAAVEEAQSLLNLNALINLGVANVDNYISAGLTRVTEGNLSDINELLKNKDCKTIKELQEKINIIIKSLMNINEGTDTVDDYTNLNITGINSNNISFVKIDIKNARNAKASDLTKSEIQKSVDYTFKYLSAMDKIKAGNGTLEDYTLLGITGVTTENLSFVNNELKGKSCSTIAELKSKVEEAIKLYEVYNKINLGEGTYEDYIRIGINIKIEEVIYFNEHIKGKSCYTFEEIQTTVTIITRERIAYEHIKFGLGTLEDYKIAGYTGITSETVIYVNKVILESTEISIEYIKNVITTVTTEIEVLKKWSVGQVTLEDINNLGLDIVTTENISYIIERITGHSYYSKTELINSIKIILKEKSIYERINLGQATIEDYQFIKVTGVTSINITSINEYVKNGNIVTRETLQGKIDVVVEQMESITHTEVVLNRIIIGKATIIDYQYMGITIVNSINIEFINEHLKIGNYTTIDQIKEAVTILVNEYNYYEKINLGQATIDIYTSLGITGVTVENLSYINIHIKNSKYLEVSELQVKINALISIYQYYEVINSGKATVDVYTSLGITKVTKWNISFINTYIKESKYFELSSLQSSINILVEKYEAYLKISSGQATIEDYKKIGITIVTDKNISYINLNINLKDCFELSVVQARIDILVKEYNSYVKISEGSATVEDYELLKIIGVTNENIKYINYELKGTNFTNIINIQAKVDVIINIYEELVRISLGTATVIDYTNIGVTGVTEINLYYINKDMKEKGYLSVHEIKERIEKVFSIYAILGRINAGEGTISDYEEVGVVGVTSSNLTYININIKGKSYESFSEIKSSVMAIIAQYEISIKIEQIIGRINLGTATIEDYKYIEILSVTEENLSAINEDLKGKDYSDLVAIRDRINVIIKIQASIKRVNLGEATLDDFRILGITGIYQDILVYVNTDLKGLNFTKIEDIQKRIDQKLNIYILMNKINLGQATLSDYVSLNITGIDASILVYINIDLKGKNYKTIEEIQQRINIELDIYRSIERINSGEATLDNYLNLGITSIDASILLYANVDLKGKNYKTVEEIQQRINLKLSIYESLKKINNGEATLDNYSILGITGLDINLIVYVNADLIGRNYTNAEEVKVRIEQNLNIYKVLKIINDGSATLDDYSKIGITEVIDFNLAYVNERIKGAALVTVFDVQERVRNIIDFLQTATVTGIIKDGSTGRILSGIAIKFRIGNSTTGNYLTKDGVEVVVYTDSEGKFSFELPEGNYTAEAVKVGYITEYFSIVSSIANENVMQGVVLVPIRTDDKYSVVLTWNATPSDLDSHLTGTTADGSNFHVYYGSNSFSKNGEVVASLDVDDTTSYGPETISFTADLAGSYKYSIFDFSDQTNSASNLLSSSGAKISVYKGSELIKTYVVPTNQTGDLWTVFEIKNGEFVDVNTITYQTGVN